MEVSKSSKLPKQVAPVQRQLSTSVAPSSQNGVEASGMFDILRQMNLLRNLG